MKKTLTDVFKYLLFLSLGVFLFWLSMRKLELKAMLDEITGANYYWAAVAAVLAIISHIFRALRWNLLINSTGYKTRTSTTFYAVMVGYMANTAVPRLGEFMRCGVLSRKEKIPFNVLFGTVISERIFDMVILVLLLATTVFSQWSLLGGFVLQMVSPLSSKLSGDGYLLLLFSFILGATVFIFFWLYLKHRHKLKKRPAFQKLRQTLSGFGQGVRTIDRMKQKGLFLFYTFMIWLFYALMVYIPFKMLPETAGLNFIAGITLLALGSLGIVAPVPGGIGAYHFIAKATLTELYTISPNTAGSFAVITHALQTLLNVVVGAWGYLMLFFIDHKPPRNEPS